MEALQETTATITHLDITSEAREVIQQVQDKAGEPIALVVGGGCCEGTTMSLFEKDKTFGYLEVPTDGPPLLVERSWADFYRGKDIHIDVVDDDGSDRMSLESRLGKHLTFLIREKD
jgi:uncharacterized protein (DUF779 family)